MHSSTYKRSRPVSNEHEFGAPNERAPMPVFLGHQEVSRKWHGGVYAIGNFDGLHIGHQTLIEKTIQIAAETSRRPAVLTFDPHPRELLDASAMKFRLSNTLQKTRDLAELGTGFCVSQHFDFDFASLSPEDFVDGVVGISLSASHVVVGSDFKFGCRQAGNTEVLRELCSQRGIGVSVIEQVRSGGEVVSSSLIRDRLGKGEMVAATRLLGRPWTIAESLIFLDGETSLDLSGYTELDEREYRVRVDGTVCRANLTKVADGNQKLVLPKEWTPANSGNVVVEFLS